MSSVGETFGAWTVVADAGKDSHGTPMLRVRCSCGREATRTTYAIVHGKSASCRTCANIKHGHGCNGARSAEYSAWMKMISRCYSPHDISFALYAGRGIGVCDEWRGDGGYERFFAHVGPRPTASHSLDRIDNDRGYEPGNVRWATPREQTNNRRNTVRLAVHGVEKPVSDWARDLGLKLKTVRSRLRSGWSNERALGLDGRSE